MRFSPADLRGSTSPSPSHPRYFDGDASIVLISLRGAGKSTLAVLAASALRFKLVDLGNVFYKLTGMTKAAYAAIHGNEAFRQQEVEQTRMMLQRYPNRAILVLGLGSVEENGQCLVRNFSRSHPVIFILRDAEETAQYLGSRDARIVADLASLSAPTFRALSNFEFYNLSDASIAYRVDDAEPSSTNSTALPLKKVEEDFLRFIFSIRGERLLHSLGRAQHSMATTAPERRPFSYCLEVPISQVEYLSTRLKQTDIMSDVVELVVNLAEVCPEGRLLPSTATELTRHYYVVRRSVKLPIMVHVAVPDDHQLQHAIFREAYLHLITHILRFMPDYLTIDFHLGDAEVATIMSNKGHVKAIGHFEDLSPQSNAWQQPSRGVILKRMLDVSCELARLTQPATCEADNDAVQKFTQHAKSLCKGRMAVIAYNTGFHGRRSCWRNRTFSPVTHTLLKPHDPHADCLLTIQEVHVALFTSQILQPQVFGIFGKNVSESASPLIHNAAFQLFQMPHKYLTLQDTSIRGLAGLLHEPNFGGASITAPFKQDVIKLVDELSPAARAIGAVNTVLPVRSSGTDALLARHKIGQLASLFGDNTDWIGIYTGIRQNLSPVNAIKPQTTGLVLGAGGMARAAVYSMMRLGIRTIFIANRTLSHAQTLSAKFQGKGYRLGGEAYSANLPEVLAGHTTRIHLLPSFTCTWPEDTPCPTVVVACIPGVDQSGPTNITVPETWLRSETGGVAIELAYDPLVTPLLRQVRQIPGRKWIAISGLDVLPEQGIAQFELFTGRQAPENLMRKMAVRRHNELYRGAEHKECHS